MPHTNFPEWLCQRYPEKTAGTRLRNVQKIEEQYGSLDEYFLNGTYQQQIIDHLQYSKDDERANKPNPSKLKFKGNIRNNLNMYKHAAGLYLNFLGEMGAQGDRTVVKATPENSELSQSAEEAIKQKLSLERDMQEALRRNITSLDPILKIIDDGAERAVDSGFIDITCEDDNGVVVIELKAGKADSRSIGQILGYMGDLQEEDHKKPVRGILIAHDFDRRAKAAARVVPTLSLKKYSIEFKFMDEE